MTIPKGPLDGVRIFDLTRYLAGSGGSRVLAGFGAEVIRVEWPHYPALDLARLLRPFQDNEPGMNNSGFFAQVNVGKLSITLNMTTEEGREVARRLIGISDLVMENYSPDVMRNWGLDYPNLVKIRPDIIYVSQSGFGQTGPYRSYGTYGPTAQAFAGLQFMTGLPDREPSGWGFSILDHMGGYYGAIAAMFALHYRSQTGRGLYIDLAQAQLASTLLGPSILDYTVNRRPYRRPGNPPGNRLHHPRIVPHNTFPCLGDDAWIVIAASNDVEWATLCGLMGEMQWVSDLRFATARARVEHESEIEQRITNWTKQRDRYELMRELQAAGVGAAVVQTARDKLESDPQIAHRDLYVEVGHAILGRRPYEGLPAKLSESRVAFDRPAPQMGEHNNYVYRELLKFSPEEIERLKANGVITDEAIAT